jgi:hypothetical protein
VPAGAHDARHLRERALDLADVREHLERARHVHARVGERQVGRAPLEHVEPAGARALEHARREIDPARRAREARDPREQEPGAAPDLEHVEPVTEALHEVDLEVIDEVVVAAGVAPAAPVLVALGELVVVCPRRVEVLVGARVAGRLGHGRLDSSAAFCCPGFARLDTRERCAPLDSRSPSPRGACRDPPGSRARRSSSPRPCSRPWRA